jgi:RNA polymerase sigma-70 factor (ECF subfamily)
MSRAERTRELGRWLDEARRGSPDALGQALEACRKYLLLIANRRLPAGIQAREAPSDLVQETFQRAAQNFHRFAGQTEKEWKAWLRRIMLNRLKNADREHRRTGRRAVGREVPLVPGDSSPAPAEPAADTPSPSAKALARECDEALHRALEQLSEEHRRVITLRNWDRLPFEEVGRVLGRSAEAARKLWERAVEHLAKLLEAPHESS